MDDIKILVVDDEPQILTLVSRFLLRAGYEVQTAGGGAAALTHLKTTPFALVLSDLKMAHIDGLRILQEIKAHYPETIFILMTAYGTLDSAVSVLRQGAYDYLMKPLDLEDLRSTVQRALEHRQVVMQNKRLMEFLQEKNVVLEYLHHEEQRKSEQLNQVNAIAREITAILDVKVLVETVGRLVASAFHFRSFSFGVIESEMLVFSGGELDGLQEPVVDSPFWKWTAGGQKPFVRSESNLSPREAPHEVVFPLLVGGQATGLWVADWEADAEYREENLPYLESLAAQAATALENARLYTLARRADELAFLNQVGLAANQSLNLEETMQSVLACVRATFNASVVEICLWDREGKVQRVFSLVEGMLRQETAPLLGDPFVDQVRRESAFIFSPADGESLHLADGTLALRTLLGVALYFNRRQVGSLSVGSSQPGAYDVEDGRLLQVVGAQVSTAIENAQLFEQVESGREMILRSRNTLQALFDGILEGIYIVDTSLQILAINRTQARWAKREFPELVGRPATLAFPDSKRSLALIKETFADGQPTSCTERWRNAEGGWTEWEIQTYPVDDMVERGERGAAPAGRGAIDRVVVVVRDVTEQRWLETSLARSEKLAAVGRLAAGIAHEINNPMTVISANAQILREEIMASHPYYSSIELIDRASERASRIVRNLLDFSRAEQFEFVQTDLNMSLEDTVTLVEPQIRRSNVEITLDLDSDLPLVWASPDHLHVVWLNLLLNARDAIEEAGRAGYIHVASHYRGDRVVVQMTDNGVGIPSDQVNRIYDPFFTTKSPGKGTGLGLFTCYRTIHRHGGEILVDSQVGVGTSFEVTLPIGQTPIASEPD